MLVHKLAVGHIVTWVHGVTMLILALLQHFLTMAVTRSDQVNFGNSIISLDSLHIHYIDNER